MAGEGKAVSDVSALRLALMMVTGRGREGDVSFGVGSGGGDGIP